MKGNHLWFANREVFSVVTLKADVARNVHILYTQTHSHKLLKQMQYYENVIEIQLSSGQVSLLFNFYLPDLSVGQVGKNKYVILLGKVIIIIMCRGIVS